MLLCLLTGCPFNRLDNKGTHWLRFVQISDLHLLDEESPARLVRMDPFIDVSWRLHESYSVQLLDASVRAINRHHTLGPWPVDFVAVTGDLVDNAQFNELRWCIDILDGGWINPNSGTANGEDNSQAMDAPHPNAPFWAMGLGLEIPWYAILGNHDCLALGTFAIDQDSPNPEDWYAPLPLPVPLWSGYHDLNPPRNYMLPTDSQSPAILPDFASAPPEDLIPVPFDYLSQGAISPDPQRHYISKEIFMREMLQSQSNPSGHGFEPENLETGHTWYTVRPHPDIPVRLVMLDTAATRPQPGFPSHNGVMSRMQFDNFLKPTFERAQAAGEHLLLFTHHPSGDFELPSTESEVSTGEFRGYLAKQPNFIAHICGHTHQEEVIEVNGPYPYQEIIAGSLLDLPQRARLFDLFYDEVAQDVELVVTKLSHMELPTKLSTEGFKRAQIDALYPDAMFPSEQWGDALRWLDNFGVNTALRGN